MIIVLFGVAGSGKSTIGNKLASAMNCAFLEADALHSPASIGKMSGGTPLTDDDRKPWLAAIHSRMVDFARRGKDLVVACSALKRQYRQVLADGVSITWVYLKASKDVIRLRLERRPSHFMKADMLASQFDDLEEPSDGIVVDADLGPDVVVAQILKLLPHMGDLRIATDLHQLSSQVAAAIVQVIAATVKAQGTCSVALSGGDTPRELYRLLGSTFRDEIPWPRVHVFWGDERYVPHDHPDSNFRMAKETLLDHVACPARNIHAVPTHFPNPEIAARDYERTLKQHFGSSGPPFDLNLLGIGDDGHTASIFPGSPALTETGRWVLAVETRACPAKRITLTLPALTQSSNIYVLVAGRNKADALRHVLAEGADLTTYPAAGLRRTKGTLIWWTDRDATAGD